MERGDEIVVLFAAFVVTEKLPLQDVFEKLRRDAAGAIRIRLRAAGGEFESIVRSTRIPVGK